MQLPKAESSTWGFLAFSSTAPRLVRVSQTALSTTVLYQIAGLEHRKWNKVQGWHAVLWLLVPIGSHLGLFRIKKQGTSLCHCTKWEKVSLSEFWEKNDFCLVCHKLRLQVPSEKERYLLQTLHNTFLWPWVWWKWSQGSPPSNSHKSEPDWMGCTSWSGCCSGLCKSIPALQSNFDPDGNPGSPLLSGDFWLEHKIFSNFLKNHIHFSSLISFCTSRGHEA